MAPYSKGEVDRAGSLLASVYAAAADRIADEPSPRTVAVDLDELRRATAIVRWWRELHAKPLSRVSANLRYYVAEQGRPIVVTQRLKRRSTILDKLCREPTMKLTQMGDIGGVRARLATQEKVDALSRRLRRNWQVVRTRDYVRSPKASGYRAVHHIVRRNGRLIEVQLRTPLQDLWANVVEADSRRRAVDFKSGRGHELVHGYYRAVSRLFALSEAGGEPDDDLLRMLGRRFIAARPYLLDMDEESR